MGIISWAILVILVFYITYREITKACRESFLKLPLYQLFMRNYRGVLRQVGFLSLCAIILADFFMNSIMLLIFPMVFLGGTLFSWRLINLNDCFLILSSIAALVAAKGELVYQSETRERSRKIALRQAISSSIPHVKNKIRFWEGSLSDRNHSPLAHILKKFTIIPTVYSMFYQSTFAPWFSRRRELASVAAVKSVRERWKDSEVLEAFNTFKVADAFGELFCKIDQSNIDEVLDVWLATYWGDPLKMEKWIKFVVKDRGLTNGFCLRGKEIRRIVDNNREFRIRGMTCTENVIEESPRGMRLKTGNNYAPKDVVCLVENNCEYKGIIAWVKRLEESLFHVGIHFKDGIPLYILDYATHPDADPLH